MDELEIKPKEHRGGAGRGQGRKTKVGESGKLRPVRLSDEDEAIARLAGNGERSSGIRVALNFWADHHPVKQVS